MQILRPKKVRTTPRRFADYKSKASRHRSKKPIGHKKKEEPVNPLVTDKFFVLHAVPMREAQPLMLRVQFGCRRRSNQTKHELGDNRLAASNFCFAQSVDGRDNFSVGQTERPAVNFRPQPNFLNGAGEREKKISLSAAMKVILLTAYE